MSNNIIKTKQKLTNIFVILVFIIVLIFGIIFFTGKYIRGVSIEKREYKNFSTLLDSGQVKTEDIKRFTSFQKNKFQTGEDQFRRKISYIQINLKGEILDSNIQEKTISRHIQDNIDKGDLLNIIQNKQKEGFQYKRGFFVKKIFDKNKGTYFVLFKEIRYTFEEYLEDVLWFILINILFSIFLYFIGKKFINRTFIPVEENIADMKDFIHNAGHELKTPISVIDSNIQLMDDMKKYNPEMTAELKVEVLRLNSVIDGLIELSDIDNFQSTSKNDLHQTVDEVLGGLKKEYKKKDIIIKNTLTSDITIIANNRYLQILLNNILKNAIKYNKEGGQIKISYKNKTLTIKDTGIGMKSEDINKIFDRFYKIDSSRNSEGFGIGLSLVQKIADIYDWKISVKSKIGHVSSFSIKM